MQNKPIYIENLRKITAHEEESLLLSTLVHLDKNFFILTRAKEKKKLSQMQVQWILQTDLESFQNDFWSSVGTTRVAFNMRAATTASVIWQKKYQEFNR